jgi:hypothetical protein
MVLSFTVYYLDGTIVLEISLAEKDALETLNSLYR